MSARKLRTLVGLSSLFVVACGGTEVEDNVFVPRPHAATYEEDIGPLLADACGDCHGEAGSEIRFDTYERAVVQAPRIRAVLLEGTMPACEDASLSQDELDAFMSWYEADFPRHREGPSANPAD